MAKPQKRNGKWRIRWADHTGKRKSESYKEYKNAVLALRRHELDAEKARAGYSLGATGEQTFDELCDYWIKYRVPEKRSGKKDISVIRVHLRPAFGALRLRDISVAEVNKFKSRFTLSPKTLHNVLTLLRAMLNYASTLDWLGAVPRFKLPVLAEREYRYLRTHEEIERFLDAALVEGLQVYALYCTAVYTGMRQGELAGLKWDSVNLESRLIKVHRSYDGPTKAGYIRHAPIMAPLLPVLTELKAASDSDWLFTSSRGAPLVNSSRQFKQIFHRVLTRAGFNASEGTGAHYIRFHDLRHTFASHWVMNGGNLFRLQKIGGWQSSSMVQRYAHLSPDVFAEDFDRFGPARKKAKVLKLAVGE